MLCFVFSLFFALVISWYETDVKNHAKPLITLWQQAETHANYHGVGILFIHKNEWSTNTCYNVDNP